MSDRRSPEVHSMDQFRTNFVIWIQKLLQRWPCHPYRWGWVQLVKPSERVVSYQQRPLMLAANLEQQKEPLTFSTFRANERGGAFFGQNLVAKKWSLAKAGDVVEVLKPKRKQQISWRHLGWVVTFNVLEREEIARDFTTFGLEPASKTIIHCQVVSQGNIYRLRWWLMARRFVVVTRYLLAHHERVVCEGASVASNDGQT